MPRRSSPRCSPTWRPLDPDLILAPTLNRTWLEIAVAAHFKGVRSVVLGSADVDPLFAASLRLDLGVDPASAFRETVASDRACGDVESQHRFAEHLIGPQARPPPSGHRGPEGGVRQGARRPRTASGCPRGNGRPSSRADSPTSPSRPGPRSGFAEVARGYRPGRSRSSSSPTRTRRPRRARSPPPSWSSGAPVPGSGSGRTASCRSSPALLKESRLYVGHDTGAMHIAGAVGRPVVGIFGGGHWPRFRPSARQAVSVVQPLPCFGCNWDCHFGDGPCVKTIPASDVILAPGARARRRGESPIDAVLESHVAARGVARAHRRRHARDPGPQARPGRAPAQDRGAQVRDRPKDVEIADLKAPPRSARPRWRPSSPSSRRSAPTRTRRSGSSRTRPIPRTSRSRT